MELSVLKMSGKEITRIFSKSKSKKYTIISNVFQLRNQRLFILSFFLLIPMLSFSTPPTKRAKKVKTVKAVKRNILEIEFGTFKYESPVIAKKSVFLG
ncbi:MAG: hypothetical protein K9I84_14785 [Leadbetterella sp.]|jgi:hypothetical protein|nr:hypothetical protein [Leadbetterella sp.]